MKNQEYDICMLAQYESAGMDLKSFCTGHYNTTNGFWTKNEINSNSFYVSKHECLLNAGIKRGVEFCKDQNVLDPSKTDKDLYKCYGDYSVSNKTYAADKCNFEFPKDSPTLETRESYYLCMKTMKVDLVPKTECQFRFFWQYDSKLIDKCEKIVGDLFS